MSRESKARTDQIIRRLLGRQLAVTTFKSSDLTAARIFLQGLNLGQGGVLRWGIGPSLARGSIAAMYVPKKLRSERREGGRKAEELNKRLEAGHELGRIKHLYMVASDTTDATELTNFSWNNLVLLENRLDLENGLLLNEDLHSHEMKDKWPWTQTNFRRAGHRRKPLTYEEAGAFWRLVFRKNPDLVKQIKTSWLPRGPGGYQRGPSVFRYQVALSYATADRQRAEEIARACDERGISVYYDRSEIGRVADSGWLRRHLNEVFTEEAQLGVALISRDYEKRTWTNYELKVMHARALMDAFESMLLVSLDGTRHPEIGGYAEGLYLDFGKIGVNGVVTRIHNQLQPQQATQR